MTYENFLQVRDEFSVLSPYYDGMDSGGGVNRVRKSKAARGKSKPEGISWNCFYFVMTLIAFLFF